MTNFFISTFVTHRLMSRSAKAISWPSSPAIPSKCNPSFLPSLIRRHKFAGNSKSVTKFVRHFHPTLSRTARLLGLGRVLASNNAKTCRSRRVTTLFFTRDDTINRFEVYFNGHDAPTRNTCSEDASLRRVRANWHCRIIVRHFIHLVGNLDVHSHT